MWIGLAARDSLRLEAGLCLHGQDITPETDPVPRRADVGDPQGHCGQLARFVGADALRDAIARGPRARSASA